MPDRPFRWGPFLTVVALLGVGLYGWLYAPVTVDGTPPRAPTPVSMPAPLPPEPPAQVRPVALAPAQVPAFDPARVTVDRSGAVTVSGTVDAGATVSLVANGVAIAEVVAGGDGAWTLGPTPLLAPGTTEFRLRSALPDGRSATSTGTLRVVMPRTTAEAFVATLMAPGQPPAELVRVDPTPVVPPAFADTTVTPDGTMTVRAQVDGGARLTLLMGDRELAQAQADAQGAVTLGPVQAPGPGRHRLELRSTHPDGRVATSPDALVLEVPALADGAFTATRETPGQPPAVLARREAAPATPPTFGTVEARPDGLVTIEGVAHPGGRVGLLSGDTQIAEVIAGPDGRFAIQTPAPLAPGRHVLTLRTTLTDGRSATAADRLIVERPADDRGLFAAILESPGGTARTIARVEPAPVPPPVPRFETVEVAPDGMATLSGRSIPGARLALVAGERVIGEATADASGAWTITLAEPFPAGATEAALRATSADGRASVASEERLAVIFPTIAGESYGVVIDGPQGARLLHRGIATARPGIAVFVPTPVPPAPPPAVAAPVTPAAPASPAVSSRAVTPTPAPVVRANVPPPRRALPDHLIK